MLLYGIMYNMLHMHIVSMLIFIFKTIPHIDSAIAVWIITVGHWLKSKQNGSTAVQTAPGRTHGRLLSLILPAQLYSIAHALADRGQ